MAANRIQAKVEATTAAQARSRDRSPPSIHLKLTLPSASAFSHALTRLLSEKGFCLQLSHPGASCPAWQARSARDPPCLHACIQTTYTYLALLHPFISPFDLPGLPEFLPLFSNLSFYYSSSNSPLLDPSFLVSLLACLLGVHLNTCHRHHQVPCYIHY